MTARPAIDITNPAGPAYLELIDGLVTDPPSVYNRSGHLATLNADHAGKVTVTELDKVKLSARYRRTHHTYLELKNGSKIESFVPYETCARILADPDMWATIPPLHTVAYNPVVTDNGVLTAAGYDHQTGIYMHPKHNGEVNHNPTDEAVQHARNLVVDRVLADFPWEDTASRTNYLAALLTPIIRPLLHGEPTPLVIVSAPMAGTGKTLLTDIMDAVYGVHGVQWGESEGERRKQFTTALRRSADPVLRFDNMPNGYTIRSAQLSQLITAKRWSDRILGVMESGTYTNDRLWVATGNGLGVADDMVRRAVWVRIDADTPKPAERSEFVLGDLSEWLQAHAAALSRELVTLVTAWLDADCPPPDTAAPSVGSFHTWANIMHSLLSFHGWNDLLGNREQVNAQVDATEDDWGPFLNSWFAAYGDRPVTVKELSGTLGGDLLAAWPEDNRGNRISNRSLSQMLRARRNAYVGSYHLADAGRDPSSNVTRWSLRSLTPANGDTRCDDCGHTEGHSLLCSHNPPF